MYNSADFLCLISIEKNKAPHLIAVTPIELKQKDFVNSIVSEDMGSSCEDLLCFSYWGGQKWTESPFFINDPGLYIAYSSCWSDYYPLDGEHDCGVNKIKSIKKASFDEINLFYQDDSPKKEQSVKLAATSMPAKHLSN